jgi:hypothetical protein
MCTQSIKSEGKMQRSSLALAVLLLLVFGMAQPAAAENPVRESKKLAVTILNNGFQPAAGKIDEEILGLLRAERASDRGLVGFLKLEQCARPLNEDCMIFALDRTRLELAAELSKRGTAGWIVVVRTGSNPYDGFIWTIGANNLGAMRALSQRHPGTNLDSNGFLGIAAYAGLCPDGKENGRCVVR